MTGAFAQWQARYAEHNVAIFPVWIVDGDKRPAIRGWGKVGITGSAQLALKFPAALSFGFTCGRRNRLTVVDLDSDDDAVVREGERLFGPSPLLWRTGSGKFAMAFRHNGEARRIRAIPGLPIDLLGGGFCVAPGSVGARRPYELIRGTLADLDRLPVARLPEEIRLPDRLRLISNGHRHKALFDYCRRTVDYCDDLEQFIDAAATWADQSLDPLPKALPIADIRRTCTSVWKYREGRRRVMNVMIPHDKYRALLERPEHFAVFSFLASENGLRSRFFIADGLGEHLGWPRRLVPTARSRMLELDVIERLGKDSETGAYLYRWKACEPALHQTAEPRSETER